MKKYKECSMCRTKLPLTREHFYVDRSAKSSYKSKCKRCEGNSYAINNIYGNFNIRWGTLQAQSGIYKIKCIVNKKIYIGSAVNICKRWSAHLHELRNNKHANKYMQNAFNKYGEASFHFSIVEIVLNANHIISREQYWLDYYQSYNRTVGFNVLKQAGSCLGNTLKASTKEKLKRVLNKPVLQVDHHGKIIARHLSAKEARRKYGFSESRIYNCANSKIDLYRGFLWVYEQDKAQIEQRLFTVKKRKRTILQYDKEGNFIKEWDISIQKIADQLGKAYINIPNCCNGNQKTLGGYIWRYRNGIQQLDNKLKL